MIGFKVPTTSAILCSSISAITLAIFRCLLIGGRSIRQRLPDTLPDTRMLPVIDATLPLNPRGGELITLLTYSPTIGIQVFG